MTIARRLAHLAVVMLLFGWYGCSATLESIPTGKWEGEGEWYARQWNDQGRLERTGGKYTVTVSVSRHEVKERELLLIRVHSKHPENSPFEHEDVHVVLGLTNVNPASDGSVLCNTHAQLSLEKLLDPGDSIEEGLASLVESDLSPPARLVRFGRTDTIELRYLPWTRDEPLDFLETFAFTGDRLVKKGCFGPEAAKVSMLSWTENLHRIE